MKLKYIIIVPHGYCISNKIRDCDIVAKNRSLVLLSNLKSRNIEVEYFISDRLRSEIDYNRKESESSDLIKRFTDTIKSNIKNGYKIVILEVHSFPKNVNMFDNLQNPEIGFISIPKYYDDMLKLADYMNTKVPESTGYTRGTMDNYLQYITQNMSDDIKHYLIEFSENNDAKNIEQICDLIVEGSLQNLDKNTGKRNLFYNLFTMTFVRIILLTLLIIIISYWLFYMPSRNIHV